MEIQAICMQYMFYITLHWWFCLSSDFIKLSGRKKNRENHELNASMCHIRNSISTKCFYTHILNIMIYRGTHCICYHK